MSFNKNEAKCKMYTIHGYKGLEDDIIRIASDVELDIEEEDVNIFYVALTRGMKYIIMDNISMIDNGPELNDTTDIRKYVTRTEIQSKVVVVNEVNRYTLGVQTKLSDYFR